MRLRLGELSVPPSGTPLEQEVQRLTEVTVVIDAVTPAPGGCLKVEGILAGRWDESPVLPAEAMLCDQDDSSVTIVWGEESD